ncbi:PadR family transcriptional regulator [Fictibacillus aquaticus]|uniref:PadR family transcriptional regulator n=1 Tax=Fictibacillus aquaticus TaxID=2021314 RepID=A0A235F992_9BACL|nr:PadR family transcriptional regulator [Fictibacillus aquaticus]OYD57654.1 PadR family transcriptional regulator [Fictibacillus aquaticus]
MNSKNMDSWIVQLRKGTFELAILSLVRDRAMYGYEISSALKDSPVFSISEGAIYPILKRMTEKEWIEFYWEDSFEGPRRKYYQITKEGSLILEDRIKKYKDIYDALILLGKGGV